MELELPKLILNPKWACPNPHTVGPSTHPSRAVFPHLSLIVEYAPAFGSVIFPSWILMILIHGCHLPSSSTIEPPRSMRLKAVVRSVQVAGTENSISSVGKWL